MNKSELKCNRFPGRIWKSDNPTEYRWYQDQLIPESEPIKWVSCTVFAKYLENTYNLSIREYYNIVVYDDINYQPKCSICGGNLFFYNLNKGYQEFCSHNCRALHYINIYNNDPIFKAKSIVAASNTFKRIRRIPRYNIQCNYRSLLSGKLNEEFYFYFTYNLYGHSNWIKLGVTKNPWTRFGNETNYHIRVIKTNRLTAARIERDLKFVIADYDYKDSDPENTFEWFTLRHFQEMRDHVEVVFATYGFRLQDLKRLTDY